MMLVVIGMVPGRPHRLLQGSSRPAALDWCVGQGICHVRPTKALFEGIQLIWSLKNTFRIARGVRGCLRAKMRILTMFEVERHPSGKGAIKRGQWRQCIVPVKPARRPAFRCRHAHGAIFFSRWHSPGGWLVGTKSKNKSAN